MALLSLEGTITKKNYYYCVSDGYDSDLCVYQNLGNSNFSSELGKEVLAPYTKPRGGGLSLLLK